MIGTEDGQRCNRITTGNPGGLFDGKPCIGDMHYPEEPAGCECYGDSGPCRVCESVELECDVCGTVVEDDPPQCPHGEPLNHCEDCVREHQDATR